MKRTENAEPSQNLLNNYIVLRVLFRRPLLYQELKKECKLPKLRLIGSLGTLIHYHKVKREKIVLSKEAIPIEFTELGIARDMMGINKPKERITHKYTLLPAGEGYLAYMEFKESLWEKCKTPWSDDLNKNYYKQITNIIKSHNYYGFTHTG